MKEKRKKKKKKGKRDPSCLLNLRLLVISQRKGRNEEVRGEGGGRGG